MATNIEWTDETWNIIVGCSRVPESPGCARCYAATAAKSPRLQQFPQYKAVSKWDGSVQFVESQLLKPLRWRKPKKIFVCSMADLFHANVPDAWIDRVMAIAALSPQHTFQILTKRPQRALDYIGNKSTGVGRPYSLIWDAIKEIGIEQGIAYSTDYMKWPLPNVWIGVSTENQQTADKRIPILLQVPAVVRFLSCEPLLENIQLSAIADSNWQHNPDWHPGQRMGTIDPLPQLSWLIVGGESGPNSRPCHIEWLESIVRQCQASNTPVFVKQLGANAHHQGQRFQTRDKKGGEIEEFPEQLRIREFPMLVHE